MADVYGHSTADAGTLAIGGQVTSDIEASADADWFRVALTGGTTYRFELRGNSAILKLFDEAGLELPHRVETRDGLASITFTPLVAGNYYLEVYGRREVWNYTLQAAVAPIQDDFRNDIATTGVVNVGGEVAGMFEVDGDQDWFRVALEAETTYAFDLRGIVGGDWSHDNLAVRLFDASGADLRVGAISNTDGVASMAFTPLTAGTYHVVVRKDGDAVDGSYTLQATVAAVQDDFRDDVATAGLVAIDGQSSGSIEVPTDTDWFRVELMAGQTYRFELSGAAGGNSAQRPGLRIMAPAGESLGPTSREGTTLNPVYVHTALTSGTYHLAVSNADGIGAYTLGASLFPYPRNFIGGGAGNDLLATTGAIDVIAGGAGVDTVSVGGSLSDYRVTGSVGNIVVDLVGQQSDFLYGIERVQFNDRALAFDVGFDANAGRVVRTMLVTYGGAAPDTPAYIGKNLRLLDQGMSFEELLQRNLDAVLGTDATSEEIVTLLYTNVARTAPPAQAMDYYTALLDDGVFTPAQLAMYAASHSTLVFHFIGLVGIRPLPVLYTDYAVLS